jgi:hypothetical protein
LGSILESSDGARQHATSAREGDAHLRKCFKNGNLPWIKIRNRRYSQMIGRDELFERRYEQKGAPEIGWSACANAAANAA